MIDPPPPFDEAWFLILLGLIVGLSLGSFVTMLCYRLPRRLSLIKPGSHCPHCKTLLKAQDLIPVLSWLIYKGRCRYCGTEIGARYIFIELVTGISIASAFYYFGFQRVLIIPILSIVAIITFLAIKITNKKSSH